jgi:ABC-type antimicrobial peptide transport system permease subunit
MQSKSHIWLGAAVGSMFGGMVPNLWHAGYFSISGIVFSALGAIFGIWVMFKLTKY